jgi:hypothetical protein
MQTGGIKMAVKMLWFVTLTKDIASSANSNYA